MSWLEKDIAIALSGLNKTYKDRNRKHIVFNNLNLDISENKTTCILGPSGCGKTTLLNLITRIDKPTNGEVTYASHLESARVAYVFQEDLLLPWRNSFDNAMLGVELLNDNNDNRANYKNKVNGLFEEFELQNSRKSYPSQLSGGMKQRVALIRALAISPKILAMDEPFSNLDYVNKLALERLMLREALKDNSTLIFVTHDIGEAIAVGNRVILLSQHPAKILLDINISYETDLAGRDPINVRKTAKYSQYFKAILDTFEDE